MLVISLVCTQGMSTSMLIKKMEDHAKEKGIEIDVDALPNDQIDSRIDKTDILLIGPQLRYLYKKYKSEYGDKIPVIQVMNMSDYGLLKAAKMFDEAYSEYVVKTGT